MTAMAPPSLAEFQRGFVEALWQDGPAWRGPGQPAFAVYRNTVMSGCIEALEANFPSVLRLVGRDWFRDAAKAFVRAMPPSDGRLLYFGAQFAAFLDGFAPAGGLPYLSGVARLDRCWIEAHTAADAPPADPALLAGLAPEALGSLVLSPHPAARWYGSDQLPVYTLWLNNRTSTPMAAEIVWQGEAALLVRPHDTVLWQPTSRAAISFLGACALAQSLGEAAATTLRQHPETDLAALLSTLLCAGALCGPTPSGGQHA